MHEYTIEVNSENLNITHNHNNSLYKIIESKFTCNVNCDSTTYIYHIPTVLPTWYALALLFLSHLALYCLLCHLSLSSLSITFHFHVATHNKQYLEKSSILCYKSSMAWLTIETIYGESVIFTLNHLWHG